MLGIEFATVDHEVGTRKTFIDHGCLRIAADKAAVVREIAGSILHPQKSAVIRGRKKKKRIESEGESLCGAVLEGYFNRISRGG